MDLLNSILNSMETPPTVTEQQKKVIKRQKEVAERLQNKQKEEMLRFRKYAKERIERFAKDDRTHLEFQPLDKIYRAIIHEVAEHAGFLCMSFGREDIDRYSVVYKKETAPTDDEILARRNGDGWNEEIAKEYAEHRKQQRELETEQKKLARNSNHTNSAHENHNGDFKNDIKPTSNYKDKYAHLIGQDAALEAARKTETNKSYGFVPSKNKKDMRSIEQTLADIQAKKKLKLQLQQEHIHQYQKNDPKNETMPSHPVSAISIHSSPLRQKPQSLNGEEKSD